MEDNPFNAPKDPQAYELTFEHRPQYLYAYVTGDEDSYEISRRYWLEIAAECRRVNCKKLLVEEDISMPVSIPEVYQLASELPQMGFTGIRVAFVDRYLEHQTLNEFGALVATNRGSFGRIFNNFVEAEDWLLNG